MKTLRILFALVLSLSLLAVPACSAQPKMEAKPAAAFFDKYEPVKAPTYDSLYLKPGDRLAIVGDSITEQKMYSRIMETYLTVCQPELNVSVRQYGWSGETAEGFLRRMQNDCLRFKPTIATTCYGMNDFRYRPIDAEIDRKYRENYTAVARAFKDAGARVVLGSPGCVDKVAAWVKSGSGTLEEHNLHLAALRNIGIEIARQEQIRFADIFWPMLTAGHEARQKYAPDYAIAGKDGVHPGWAGHTVMAYAFLKSMGVDGNLGTFTVDLKKGRATASAGHTVESFADNTLTLTSRRYPFCATGDVKDDNSIRSGMSLVPFNKDLNRLTLVVRGATAAKYRITWGDQSRVYTAEQLGKGINLADDFAVNPFSEAFRKVDEAVAAKQAFETRQVKSAFHGKEAKGNMEEVVEKTEAERRPLVEAIKAAFVPVRHAVRIEAE